MAFSIMDIQEMLKKKQNGSRFVHTLGVQYTSACLAMKYGADMASAQLAGLLHDCAKHLKPERLLSICRDRQLEITKAQEHQPFLLHGRVGAFFAREKYDVMDDGVLSAIEWHTTGKPGMTLLEKIVFVADYIEPNRNKAPKLEDLRKISFENIDMAVYLILEQTLDYLNKMPEAIDETTEKTYNYYKQLLKL